MGGSVLKIDQPFQDYPRTEEFRNIYRSHFPKVVGQIMQIVHDQTLAEDLAQEVFIKLYPVYQEIESIPAWLYKCALHIAFNAIRSQKRNDSKINKQRKEALLVADSTEERWFRKDDIEAVRMSLLCMPERERTLLLMKYSGFNYKELANAVQVEESSIGTLLARAKKKFMNLYQQRRGNEK